MTATTYPTTLEPERWLPVVGYEGKYEVSSYGRVKTLARLVEGRDGRLFPRRERIMRLCHDSYGYAQVELYLDGVGKPWKVHHLVLNAFVGPRPKGYQACHNDAVRDNNMLDNLRWDSAAENIRDSVRMGTQANTRKTHCPQGHPYDEANTHVDAKGWRRCRRCGREKAAARAKAQRAVAA